MVPLILSQTPQKRSDLWKRVVLRRPLKVLGILSIAGASCHTAPISGMAGSQASTARLFSGSISQSCCQAFGKGQTRLFSRQ
jgi:hypothetical protein